MPKNQPVTYPRKITIEIEMDLHEIMHVRLNSIERVMNNAINVGSRVSKTRRPTEGDCEDASTLWQDCEELKPTVRKLWEAAREAIYKSSEAK